MLPVDPAHAAVLQHFNVPAHAYVGGGGEARVYALDEDRVVRVERGEDSGGGLAYMARRQQFYATLRDRPLPFALPEVLDVGKVAGIVYAVERRLPGRSLQDRYTDLNRQQRATAQWSLLEAAHALATVPLPEQPYGELLMRGSPLRAPNWPDYLRARFNANLTGGYADLVEDVPDVDQTLAQLRAHLDGLDRQPPPCLVHGDFGPANVLFTEDLRVSAVLDFGYATLAGDPRLDLAGALAFIELAPGYAVTESHRLRDAVARRWGAALLPVLDLYAAYYAVYFSGCKADDPSTYWWCVTTLRAWRAP